MTEWIVIPNWEKYNERSDRSLPWFKVYYHLTRRDDFRQLSLSARGLLVSLWCEYGPAKGQIRHGDVTQRVGQRVRRETLDSLVAAGFIRIVAAQPPELSAVLEKKREEKTPKPPSAKPEKPKVKTTGWRIVRGSHGMTTIPDPNGTDPAPTIGRPL